MLSNKHLWPGITEEDEDLLREELKKFLDGDEEDSVGFKPLPSGTIEVDRISKGWAVCMGACEEGMTELNGYFICKHCGTNMRKTK